MKLLNKSIYALSLVSLMGLWSCSSDEALPGTTIAGKAVPLSITVSRGDAQTRTIVSENDEAGLNSVWKEGDVIGLYNSKGEKAGELKLKEGEENKSSSVFEGTVTGGSGTYNLWYFGQPDADGKYSHIDFTAKKPKLTLSTTPITEASQLAEYDIMSKAAEIVVSNDKAAVKDNVTMDSRMAMAKFSFAGLPENKSGKLTISNIDATYTTLYTSGNINLTEHGIGVLAGATKDYVIEGVATDKDLYIALLPDVEYKLGFTFEVDDKVYTHNFEKSTKLKAGLYYNGGIAADGSVNGYELSFETEPMAELHLYANFEGANPEEIVIYKKFENGQASFDISSLDYSSYVGTDGSKLPARDGYEFIGWNENEVVTSGNSTSVTVSPNSKRADYFAVWEKVTVVDKTNPADMGNWGGINIDPEATDIGVTFVSKADGWVLNVSNTGAESYGGFGTYIRFDHNGMINGHLTSKGGTSLYYQWGRWLGLPASCGYLYLASNGAYSGDYEVSAQLPLKVNYFNTKIGYSWANHLSAAHGQVYMGGDSWTNERALNSSIMFGRVTSLISHSDYVGANEVCSWEDRSGNPAPDGYRIPTKEELSVFVPSTGSVSGTYAEVKTINGENYAMQWKVIAETNNSVAKVQIRSFKTSSSSVSTSDSKFNSAPVITLMAYGFIDNEGNQTNYGTNALYWSSTSEKRSNDTNGASGLYIAFSGSNATFSMMPMKRCLGGLVYLIKDDAAKSTSLTPWFPLTGSGTPHW